jgi:integrase
MPRRKQSDLSIPGHIWQQPSGRWSGRYTADTMERPQRTFATREEVVTWLYEIDKRRRLGRYIPPSELTVDDLVQRYLEQGEVYQSFRPVTLHRHRRNYELHIQPSLGSLRVQEVDRTRMRHWMMQMAAKYSASLVANCLAVLNGAFTEAVELGIVDTNPCARLKRPPEQRKEMTTWTLEECARLWSVLQDEPMWFAIYRLMLATGMRQGELRALVWGDISFEAQRVHIRRTMTLSADGRVIVGTTTKTDTGRAVALAAGPLAALSAWRSATVVRPFLRPENNFVFGIKPGYPLGLTHWQNWHKTFIARAGIPFLSLHSIRHTFATLALEEGIPIKVVSDILGHSRIETTMNIYQHITDDMQRVSVDLLDARIFGHVTPSDSIYDKSHG